MEVSIDGETYSGNYRSVNIFNSSYFGGLFHSVDASIDDGKLDVIITKRAGALKTFLSLPHYLKGRLNVFHKLYSRKQGQKITLTSDKTQVVFLDEQIFFRRQISLELLPGAVKFVDPRLNNCGGGT